MVRGEKNKMKKISGKKNKKKNRLSKKIAKAHMIFSIGLFVFYIALSAVYSPEFLLSDIRQKFQALADETLAITARVLDPPAEPIVSGSAVCSNGSLSVNLDWADDENSESFSIEKDGSLLVDGLITSQYEDAMVVVDDSYLYIVTAYGPMGPGFAESQPVVITTPEECQVNLPNPTLAINSFSEKSVARYSGISKTDARRPDFSGTTNIANADISILINSPTIISAQTVANANGYWSWTPPADLNFGSHTLYVTAVDPSDPSRTVSISFNFKIIKEEDDDEEDGKNNTDKKKQATIIVNQPLITSPLDPETLPQEEKVEIPLNFSLFLKNNEVFQGKDLETLIHINKLDSVYEGTSAIIRYTVLDEKGENKISVLENATLNSQKEIKKNINIPGYFKSGRYKVKAEIIFNQYNVSQDKVFSVVERPLIKLGGGLAITYPELLSNLGLIASFLIFLLIFWLFLFYREHRLYLHALRHITERNLERIGLFGQKRKGVSR